MTSSTIAVRRQVVRPVQQLLDLPDGAFCATNFFYKHLTQ